MEYPIVDSKMTIAEAVGKDVPPEIRQRQKLVTVTYYSFDDKVHQGQIVVDERLADDVQEVFRVALRNSGRNSGDTHLNSGDTHLIVIHRLAQMENQEHADDHRISGRAGARP